MNVQLQNISYRHGIPICLRPPCRLIPPSSCSLEGNSELHNAFGGCEHASCKNNSERKVTSNQMSKRLAVFIDAENVSFRHFDSILEQLKDVGLLATVKVYGNWSNNLLNGWKRLAKLHDLEKIHQDQTGKNAADMVLVMDVIEFMHYRLDIDAFCLVSSDSDFSQLSLRLRGRGKTVLGFGEAKSPIDYRKTFSEFTVLGALPPKRSSRRVNEQKSSGHPHYTSHHSTGEVRPKLAGRNIHHGDGKEQCGGDL